MDSTKTISSAFTRDAQLIGNTSESIYIYNVGNAQLKDTTTVFFRNFQEIIDDAKARKLSGTHQAAIKSGIPFDEFGDQILFDKKNDSIFSRIKMAAQYVLVAEKKEIIQWVIKEEEKKIQGYNCKMATAEYKGRSYTAWFTSQIPIPEGPYKFKGLPGLILEIEDHVGNLKIWAETIHYPADVQMPGFMAVGMPITFKDYLYFIAKEMEAKMEVELESVFAAERNQPGFNMADIPPRPKYKNYYCQIELTE